MRSKIILQLGESLRLKKSKSKGSMAQTEIDYYAVINAAGETVGSVEHEDHTSLNGFKRTQHVTQWDSNGKILVQETW